MADAADKDAAPAAELQKKEQKSEWPLQFMAPAISERAAAQVLVGLSGRPVAQRVPQLGRWHQGLHVVRAACEFLEEADRLTDRE
jgi:hypothetical protein